MLRLPIALGGRAKQVVKCYDAISKKIYIYRKKKKKRERETLLEDRRKKKKKKKKKEKSFQKEEEKKKKKKKNVEQGISYFAGWEEGFCLNFSGRA